MTKIKLMREIKINPIEREFLNLMGITEENGTFTNECNHLELRPSEEKAEYSSDGDICMTTCFTDDFIKTTELEFVRKSSGSEGVSVIIKSRYYPIGFRYYVNEDEQSRTVYVDYKDEKGLHSAFLEIGKIPSSESLTEVDIAIIEPDKKGYRNTLMICTPDEIYPGARYINGEILCKRKPLEFNTTNFTSVINKGIRHLDPSTQGSFFIDMIPFLYRYREKQVTNSQDKTNVIKRN